MALVAALVLLLSARTAAPQAAVAPKPAADEIAAEDVRARLKQIESAADLDDAARAKLRPLYEQALAELDEAAKREAAAAQLSQTARQAPQQLRQLRERLAELPSTPVPLPPDDADRPKMEQALSQAKDALLKAKDDLARLEAEPKRRAGRRNDVPGELNAAGGRLGETDRQLAALTEKPDATPQAAAQKTLLLARGKAVRQEMAALQQELAAYEATADILPVERDLAAAEVVRAEEAVKRIGALLDRLLQDEAARDAERARVEAAETHPLLKPLADQNRQLAEMSEQLVARIRDTTAELHEARAALDDLKKQFTRTQQKVEAVGLTNAIGLLLRKQRAALPDVATYQRLIRDRQPVIRTMKLELFEKEDRRSELATLDAEAQKVLAGMGPPPAGFGGGDWEAAVRDLLEAERQHLDALIRNYNAYFEALVDLDNAQQQLIRQADEYRDYVAERVLWIRSASLPDASTLRHAGAAALWLLDGRHWSEVGDALVADARAAPLPVALGLLVFLLLLYEQRPLRRRVAQLGSLAEQPTFCRFLPTLQALVLTALIAALWPGLMGLAHWRLSGALAPSEFVRAVAEGLGRTAAAFLPLELFRQVCRPRGLAEAHFGWPAGSLRVLRVNLRWLLVLGTPLVFVSAVLDAQGDERLENSLGRLAFVVLLGLVVFFVHRVFRPGGGLYRHLLADRREGWFYRFRHAWYALGTLAPLALAVLAGAGYYYTAYQLGLRLSRTVYVPLALAVLGAVLIRWVLVARRRMAIDRARQRRAAQAEAAPGPETSQLAAIPVTAEAEVDLTRVSAQFRTLIESFLVLVACAAVWLIWVDVLPALNVLDRVPLWPTTVAVAESTKGADGQVTVRTVERLDSITLADLMLALLTLLMTFIAARNIPGVMAIVLPQRLPINAGARYAVGTVSRYLVTIVGLMLAFSAMGISWTRLQWLIAAVSVGLGFGLQEIFANFVSGLILLFEQPIRVGDVVTVGEVSGVVSRIQIRATTITNWDRQDLIVPNKEFITGRVLNWTLSNPINRVVINVGIAYGSDTELARRLLQDILRRHPEVMDDPAPMVSFEGFGDSTLNFVVRAFLPNLDKRLQTIHELHTAIDRAFREHGIEIAFPQRDVHIRSMVQAGERPGTALAPAAQNGTDGA